MRWEIQYVKQGAGESIRDFPPLHFLNNQAKSNSGCYKPKDAPV